MEFEELKKYVREGLPEEWHPTQMELLCFDNLRIIYKEQARHWIDGAAANEREERVQKAFELARADDARQAAAYAQYQENIRQAGEARSILARRAREGAPLLELFKIALKIISRMTCEDETEKSVLDALNERGTA